MSMLGIGGEHVPPPPPPPPPLLPEAASSSALAFSSAFLALRRARCFWLLLIGAGDGSGASPMATEI